MLMSIDYLAHAVYDTDGSVTLTPIPIATPASPQGFFWTQNGIGIELERHQSVVIININYHNSLEDSDPYYRVVNVWNDESITFDYNIPSKSYYYVYDNQSAITDQSFIVFVNKDNEILCSVPEAGFNAMTRSQQAAASYFDYEFWRISTKYMPNLIPLS